MTRHVLRAGIIAAFIAVLSWSSGSAAASVQATAPGPRRVLTVSLYPFIPNAAAAYYAVEQAFEARNPAIDLRVSLNANYYDDRPNEGGIIEEVADVYELDSVFLADFLADGRIAPLTPQTIASIPELIPWARTIAGMPGGGLAGAPHWVCGNFFFYRLGDGALAGATNLRAIEVALGPHPAPARALLIDLKGKSTLGELYLDALMDRHGSGATVLAAVVRTQLDPEALAALMRIEALAAPGMGRDQGYHDRAGFYARQFARGYGRAFVGYSEQLYYALTETQQSCRKDEGCLEAGQIAVGEWPASDSGSHPIAWVDTLVVSARSSPQTRVDAEAFIRFMMEPGTYRLFLMPGWGEAPRYLLPARQDLYNDADLLQAAPLYIPLRQRIDRATPLTARALNTRLRERGVQLDAELPAQ